MTDLLRLEYIPLPQVRKWDRNPKKHNLEKIVESIERYGFIDPPKFDPTLNDGAGGLVYGNGRDEALEWMHAHGHAMPRGVQADPATGAWCLPIIFGVDAKSQAVAMALALDHNNLTLSGGDFTAEEMARQWTPGYLEILKATEAAGELPVTVSAEAIEQLIAASMTKDGDTDDLGVTKGAKPNPRNLPIDMIFCWGGGDTSCCIAVRGGWSYGFRSHDVGLDGRGVCPVVPRSPRHRPVFIDNEFKAYDHAHHAAIVAQWKPKYATVRDIMTREQCAEAGIAFYPFEQIMEWAEELAAHAQNVIVIPKYDCIDEIPAKFMLGYSVPTSYGGTPLHIDLFKGRRVHLLGGSWKNQLAHMAALGESVVSADNNHINIIASRWGQFVDPDGNTKQMQDIGFSYLTNVRDAALSLSVGAIGQVVSEWGLEHDGQDNQDDPMVGNGLAWLSNTRDCAFAFSVGAIGHRLNTLYAGSVQPAEGASYAPIREETTGDV